MKTDAPSLEQRPQEGCKATRKAERICSSGTLGFDPYREGYQEEHLFVFAGRGSVAPLPGTVMGIGAFFFPPVSGLHFQLAYDLSVIHPAGRISDHGREEHYAPAQVMRQASEWQPWGYRREGVFHQRINGEIVSFRLTSELIAPASGDGVLLKLTFRTEQALELEIAPRLLDEKRAFGICPPGAWNYEPPAAHALLWSEGPLRWRTDGCTLHLVSTAQENRAGNGWSFATAAGGETSIIVGFSLEGEGLKPLNGNLEAHAASAQTYWEEQAKKVDASSIPENYQPLFWRGWVTAMTARWERENFVASPYYAAEGIDGGAVCSYLWDLSYPSRFLAQLEGRDLTGLIEAYLQPESFFTGYAIDPLSGGWLGVFYAFQPYALTRIVADYVEATGDCDWLNQPLPKGGTPLERLEEIVETFDQRYRKGELLDFGHNRHLIELQVADYEGIVPNPNFEHVWTLRAVEQLREHAGHSARQDRLQRADALCQAAQQQFWDAERGWYFPSGAARPVWSIQILSALRLGVFPEEAVEAMVEHLVSPRFLGPLGIYSIARDDEWHFTLSDADWGGGGCFTGHLAIIIEGLAREGMHDAAEALLKRIGWWADGLPYLPQSTLADLPRLHGRVNAVAGAAICQALLTLYPSSLCSNASSPHAV